MKIPKTMFIEDIKKIIPHRSPMLLVDEVLELEPGEKIITKFFVDPERDIFKGHFPGAPVLPGIYTVECIAQASDILLLTLDRYKGTIPYFIGIDNVKFIGKIMPGDTIEVHSKMLMERKEKGIATCRGQVFNKGVLLASGDVTLAMREG